MSDAYTPEIDFYLSRLASFSTNVFKLMPQTGATASANQIVRVAIPNNALVNTRSFKFFFNNCFIHKAIIILKVTSSIFKVNVRWNNFTISISFNNL